MAAYLGVDLGATGIRAVVGTQAGEVVGRARSATPESTGVAVTEAILDTVRTACADAGVEPETVVAAGVGSMGPLDVDEGAVVDSPNVPGVEHISLVGPLCTLLSTDRISLHNDAVAGAIGERLFGDGGDDLVYLTLSTGVGAGAIVDGHVCEGWNGNAAEVGHVTVDPTGRRTCGCGCTGHWEAYCSGSAIPGYARDLYDDEETALSLADADAAAVFESASVGDDFAARVIEHVGRWNTLGVATLVHAFAPRTIAVGGGVTRNNPAQVLDPIRERLPDHVATAVPEIRSVDTDGDAVVRGALASALTEGTGSRDSA